MNSGPLKPTAVLSICHSPPPPAASGSRYVLSPPLPSSHLLSSHILSTPLMSSPLTSHILSPPLLSHPFDSSPLTSSPLNSSHTLSPHLASSHILSPHLASSHVLSPPLLSSHILFPPLTSSAVPFPPLTSSHILSHSLTSSAVLSPPLTSSHVLLVTVLISLSFVTSAKHGLNVSERTQTSEPCCSPADVSGRVVFTILNSGLFHHAILSASCFMKSPLVLMRHRKEALATSRGGILHYHRQIVSALYRMHKQAQNSVSRVPEGNHISLADLRQSNPSK